MELKTVQTGAFKTLTEALKEILTDANIEFTDSAMKIITMDLWTIPKNLNMPIL